MGPQEKRLHTHTRKYEKTIMKQIKKKVKSKENPSCEKSMSAHTQYDELETREPEQAIDMLTEPR